MTTSNTVPERREVRADEVEPGMWITNRTRHADSYPAEVLFRSEPDGGEVVMVIRSDGRTEHYKIGQTTVYAVATDDEVAAAKDRARRMLIGNQLRDLATLVETRPGLPITQYPNASMAHGLTRVQLDEVAQLVGEPVRNTYGNQGEVRVGTYHGFHATWTGRYKDPEPESDAAAIVAESTSEAAPAAPKPAAPRKAAVKRSPAVDKPKKCPCGLAPAFAAPEAHDKPECQHRIGTGA